MARLEQEIECVAVEQEIHHAAALVAELFVQLNRAVGRELDSLPPALFGPVRPVNVFDVGESTFVEEPYVGETFRPKEHTNAVKCLGDDWRRARLLARAVDAKLTPIGDPPPEPGEAQDR